MREHDDLVEPLFAALRPEPPAPRARRRIALVALLVGLGALGAALLWLR